MKAYFAIPGDLGTPTGGYVYARRVMHALHDQDCEIQSIQLPDGFPAATEQMLASTVSTLRALPSGAPILLDGLAGGVLPARLIASLPGPVVMLCHHPLALETGVAPETAAKLRVTERDALGACSAVITTSHATAEILIRDYAVSPEKLTVAPPGTDPAPRAPADGPCRILSVGSLTRRKRHDALLEACNQHRDYDWSLQIIGPARDQQVQSDLQDQIARLNLQSRVALRGTLSTAQLAAAYQSADLFALASEYEGFGMAFTEAMSHGLPTVGIHCDAVAEATAGGAELTSTDDFPQILGSLIADSTRRKALAEDCWRSAQTFMRWPQTAAIIADVMKKVQK